MDYFQESNNSITEKDQKYSDTCMTFYIQLPEVFQNGTYGQLSHKLITDSGYKAIKMT